ncbi:MAG: AmmeMemoRadiSam system protein B [Candidatus Shapirobacteria bacterium]
MPRFLLGLFLGVSLVFGFFFFKIYFQPVSVVLPHHNLVKDKRLEFLKTIAQKRPFTRHIILIGPDHFSSNQTGLYYADANWDLANGKILFDHSLNISGLTLNNNLLKSDHAIYNLLPDLKSVFPNAQIFPILIGQKYPFADLHNLFTQINSVCRFDCLFIASVDFSHYLPAAIADVHDQKSLFALQHLDAQSLNQLEVDSPQSLYLLTQFSKAKKAPSFDLFSHTNSGLLAGNPITETTTHFIGSYQKALSSKTNSSVTTFTFTQNIDPKNQSVSLGDRFFYGVDQINPNLSFPHNVTADITLNPTKDVNSIVKNQNHLTINFSPDIAISGFIKNSQLTLVFSPLVRQGNQVFFDRSPARLIKIRSIFDSFSSDFSVVSSSLDYGSVIINL